MLRLLINSVWGENHVNCICVLVNLPPEWAFMNTFRVLGQTSSFDLFLCYYFIICPPSPLSPCPVSHPWFPLFSCPYPLLPPPSCPRKPPFPFMPVFLQSFYLTVVSGQTAQFGLFVSHNCIQCLSYMF